MAPLEGEVEAATRKAIELVLAGDTVALKPALERLLPGGQAVRLDLPLRTLGDLDQAADIVRQALAAGTIS